MITLIMALVVMALILLTVCSHSVSKTKASVRFSSSECLITSIIHNLWEDEFSNDYIENNFIWLRASCEELLKRLRDGSFSPQGESQEHNTADALAGIAQYKPAIKFLAATPWGRKQLARLYYSNDGTCCRPGAKRLIYKVVRRMGSPLNLIPPDCR